jgi:hypothetical protein
VNEALPIDEPELGPRFGHRDPIINHGSDERIADPGARRASTEKNHTLVDEAAPRDFQGRQHASQGHRGSSLDVIIEGAQPVPIAVEQPSRVLDAKILPLQQDVGELPGHPRDERLDELVVLLAPDPPVAPPEIQRIPEPLLVVGSRIEQDGKRAGRMDASAERVE